MFTFEEILYSRRETVTFFFKEYDRYTEKKSVLLFVSVSVDFIRPSNLWSGFFPVFMWEATSKISFPLHSSSSLSSFGFITTHAVLLWLGSEHSTIE